MSRYQLLVIMIKRLSLGSSMVVQWLGLSTSIAMVLVQSLAGELRYPQASSQKVRKKKKD